MCLLVKEVRIYQWYRQNKTGSSWLSYKLTLQKDPQNKKSHYTAGNISFLLTVRSGRVQCAHDIMHATRPAEILLSGFRPATAQ